MKPFNLQEALAGKPVVTRNGRTATGFHVFPGTAHQRVHVVIDGYVVSFNDKGLFWDNGSPADHDLFMASEKKEGWINVYIPSREYTGERDHLLGGVHPTEQAAKRNALPSAVATVRIEWEE